MVIVDYNHSSHIDGVMDKVLLSDKDRKKNPLDVATNFFFFKENENTDLSNYGWLVIPYKRSQEGYELPQYISCYNTVKHLPVTLALLKLMKEGQYEYKVFTCHIKDSDNDEYQGLPYNSDRKFIIDVTHERTRVALNYKALVEQLD